MAAHREVDGISHNGIPPGALPRNWMRLISLEKEFYRTCAAVRKSGEELQEVFFRYAYDRVNIT